MNGGREGSSGVEGSPAIPFCVPQGCRRGFCFWQSSAAAGGKLDPGAELLSKPYDIDTRAVRVRRILDA